MTKVIIKKGTPKKDGSGNGKRNNISRGGCKNPKKIGLGRNPKKI